MARCLALAGLVLAVLGGRASAAGGRVPALRARVERGALNVAAGLSEKVLTVRLRGLSREMDRLRIGRAPDEGPIALSFPLRARAVAAGRREIEALATIPGTRASARKTSLGATLDVDVMLLEQMAAAGARTGFTGTPRKTLMYVSTDATRRLPAVPAAISLRHLLAHERTHVADLAALPATVQPRDVGARGAARLELRAEWGAGRGLARMGRAPGRQFLVQPADSPDHHPAGPMSRAFIEGYVTEARTRVAPGASRLTVDRYMAGYRSGLLGLSARQYGGPARPRIPAWVSAARPTPRDPIVQAGLLDARAGLAPRPRLAP